MTPQQKGRKHQTTVDEKGDNYIHIFICAAYTNLKDSLQRMRSVFNDGASVYTWTTSKIEDFGLAADGDI